MNQPQSACPTDLGAIFVSLELSRRVWLITSLSPGGGEKVSKRSVPAGEVSGLFARAGRFSYTRNRARLWPPSRKTKWSAR